MSYNYSKTIVPEELRAKAEEVVRKKTASLNGGRYKLSLDEACQLIHELEVHQVELNMQNEELHRIQKELESSKERYFDLYDLAPVGYITTNGKGLIIEVNLTSSNIFEMQKDELEGIQFATLIAPQSQDVYYNHRRVLLEKLTQQSCELQMKKKSGELFWVRLEESFSIDELRESPYSRIVISYCNPKRDI